MGLLDNTDGYVMESVGIFVKDERFEISDKKKNVCSGY